MAETVLHNCKGVRSPLQDFSQIFSGKNESEKIEPVPQTIDLSSTDVSAQTLSQGDCSMVITSQAVICGEAC